eukprot:15289580-Alexandrium_andersonii.AAC.1
MHTRECKTTPVPHMTCRRPLFCSNCGGTGPALAHASPRATTLEREFAVALARACVWSTHLFPRCAARLPGDVHRVAARRAHLRQLRREDHRGRSEPQ